MNSNLHYETLYGVGLLDDLHNYFPALLYDSSEFHSVQDVLAYIQRQTRNRFDLFSYGSREYRSQHPVPAQEPVRHGLRSSVLVPPTVATTASTLPTTAVEREIQSLLRPASRPLSNPVNIAVSMEEFLDEDGTQQDSITQALLGLLRLPAGPLTRTYAPRTNMDQFLQPVVIRPTQQQIDANTTVGRLASDTEHTCPICQDILTNEQDGRKLNACGHWFHKSCIDTWFQGNVHCPVCRHDIREAVGTRVE